MMQPKPHALRITCEGDVSLLEVGNTAWVALGKTIAAKSPDLIEALDEKGVLIRAVRPAEEEDDTRSSSSSCASSPVCSVAICIHLTCWSRRTGGAAAARRDTPRCVLLPFPTC